MRIARRDLLAGVSSAAVALGLPQGSAAQTAPRRGGTVTVHMGSEQRILNGSLRASTGVYVMAAKMQEPLVEIDFEGRPVPMLATAWESSADGLTHTFRLRQGVRWHDGKPFTSADVQYTAMEMWKKHLNYGTALQLYLEAVDTPDPHTAVFRYGRPMPQDLLLRAMVDLGYISPKHVFEGTNLLENPANTAPVGTGPFKFVQYERGQFIIADRNPDYWNEGLPYLDRIVWRFITDKAAATGLKPVVVDSGDGLEIVTFEQANMVLCCTKASRTILSPDQFLDPRIESCYPKKDYHTLYIGFIDQVLVQGA